jgi:hypothetical protein
MFSRQSSLSALQNAIDAHDWETATTHCAKAMSIPLEVISGPFAESAVVGGVYVFQWQRRLIQTSRRQRVTSLRPRRCRLIGSSSWPCSSKSLKRHPAHAIQQQRLDSSNYFRPLGGRWRVWRLMLLSWLTWSGSGPLHPRRVCRSTDHGHGCRSLNAFRPH